jgi:aspartyl-tRNA(Asn)/glutamyl-tRNA(Gln) amidotransferase subunit A
MRSDFDAALAACDVLVGPATPTPAFRLGEKLDDPLAMYLNDVYTIPLNLAGYPGLSVPCGLADGLPVGLQVMGRALDEATVLAVARAYERSAGPRPRPAMEALAA